MKKLLAIFLALLMVVSVFAACDNTANDDPETTQGTVDESGNAEGDGNEGEAEREVVELDPDDEYVYKDSVGVMATNWNPHTYQTLDDSYPTEFIRAGFYSFIYNDELNPVEGKDPYTGYVIIPEMAASMPVDVTEEVKAEHPEFNIPESATSGYAYTIDLNPDAVWEDGTPINADSYVYSMKRLLDPELKNYRAVDYYAQNLSIAGAEAYANGGHTSYADAASAYTLADLTKNEDGQYVNADGKKMYIGLNVILSYLGGDTLKGYVDSFGAAYFDMTNWETLVDMMDANGAIPLTDENLALFTPVIATEDWQETADDAYNYFVVGTDNPVVEYEGTVGLYKSGDYQITMVLSKSLAGFNLLYSLSSNWLVNEDLYESCLSENNGVWTSTYNTSVETTLSYGPYKLTDYQADKHMRFERNENWYGYTDGKHQYVDPVDGKIYPMYMSTAIDTQVVAEASTQKLMFLKGELMTYGLQAEDFETYRSSDYCYATPAETTFFLILNGHRVAIAQRESAADFDKTQYDLETMTNLSFRKALAVSYDRDLFAATISPARSAGYGIIGSNYIYDPETGAQYRDTDQAKQALCDFYSVNVDDYDSLDEAAASITGYDPVAAKELFTAAFNEALEAGYITDSDGDGISDQTVRIEYCLSADDDFQTKLVNYLDEKVNEAAEGTPFEGKIEIYKSAPYGNSWSDKIKTGMSDCVLAGWSGSALDPFGLTDQYVNPAYAYDGAWFDANSVEMTMTIDGTEITGTLVQWSDALNGATVDFGGTEYNFGDGMTDVDTRLDILAALEVEFLKTYDYLPLIQDGEMSLLTQQAYYVVEEYNPIMGRGGIQYLKYNYNEDEWTDYIAEQGGELKY